MEKIDLDEFNLSMSEFLMLGEIKEENSKHRAS